MRRMLFKRLTNEHWRGLENSAEPTLEPGYWQSSWILPTPGSRRVAIIRTWSRWRKRFMSHRQTSRCPSPPKKSSASEPG